VQAVQPPASSLHSKLDNSFAPNSKLAVVLLVGSAGPLSTVAVGATVSIVHP
jgi:hypothetical protein